MLDTLERHLEKIAIGHDPVSLALLKSIPGVGRILSMVMLYEIESIDRFPRVQDFVSYCRLVKPAKESNGKSYAEKSGAIRPEFFLTHLNGRGRIQPDCLTG